jgi:hypothetical protein
LLLTCANDGQSISYLAQFSSARCGGQTLWRWYAVLSNMLLLEKWPLYQRYGDMVVDGTVHPVEYEKSNAKMVNFYSQYSKPKWQKVCILNLS